MDVKEVLLKKFVEQTSGGNSQTGLGLKKVDVRHSNVGEIADNQKRIVGIDHIRSIGTVFIASDVSARGLIR